MVKINLLNTINQLGFSFNLLAFEDSCSSNCGQAHAVSDENDDVLCNVCVWSLLERKFDLIFPILQPEVLVFFKYFRLFVSAGLESFRVSPTFEVFLDNMHVLGVYLI